MPSYFSISIINFCNKKKKKIYITYATHSKYKLLEKVYGVWTQLLPQS